MRFLDESGKQQRVNVYEELRQIASDDTPFLSRIVTGDEPRDKATILPIEKPKLTETENGETGEEQSHNFIWHQGRNSFSQAKQTIPHTPVTLYYGDCLKMRKDFALNFGDKRTGCCITTHRLTLPFSSGIFLPKRTWLSTPTHPTFLCFPS
jgi:hypothetical protein